MTKVIDTTDKNYIAYCKNYHQNKKGFYNGAYYYSKEIVQNIIPNVDTNRPWDTLGMRPVRSCDHAIVFLHHNLHPERNYKWLQQYFDLVYVCSNWSVYAWASNQPNGHAVFLPLSIDVDYVKKFRTSKTKDACYAGNLWAFKSPDIRKFVPGDIEFPPKNIPREELLRFIAPFKICYAVGRTAIEAKCLGCEIGVCDSRFQNPGVWEVLSNQEAALILQAALDQIPYRSDRPRKR